MNGQQKPEKKEWKELVEELETALHNITINKILIETQLTKAREQARGQ